MKVLISEEPFCNFGGEWHNRGRWPAKWVGHPRVKGDDFAVVAYRRRFAVDSSTTVRLHVSADQRYELFVDGARIGRGPERGDRENWFYETYELNLEPGEHVIVAKTWWLRPGFEMYRAPFAQMTERPGFLLGAEGVASELLDTGVAQWQCKIIGGYELVDPEMTWGTGSKVRISGDKYPWGFESGAGEDWQDAEEVSLALCAATANESVPVWRLRPAVLPAMLEEPVSVGTARYVCAVDTENTRPMQVRISDSFATEADMWNALLAGKSELEVPSNTMCRVIVDLGNYFTAFPELTTSSGAGSFVRMNWAEALFEQQEEATKGNRDEIDGKYFIGVGDTFMPDGGSNRVFSTLWWEAGRYIEIVVKTADEPLVIESLRLREEHYPYQQDCSLDAADTRFAEVFSIAKRSMEMCSHETYMDCPYYEQLMYVGDTRLEALTTYALTRDDRLPRKALLMFDVSRKNSGITHSRYPSYIEQVIPPFSLWWVSMVHDYAMWRDDSDYVLERMRGVRAVLDAYRGWMNSDGLVEAPVGWNFMDWVPNWRSGIPPEGDKGINGLMNWQMVYALRLAAELEDMVLEPEMAQRNRRQADALNEAVKETFWNEDRGMFAEDAKNTSFSEHSQCLSLLCNGVKGSMRERVVNGLLTAPDLDRTTIYFTHYLFETYRLIHRMDKFFERMSLWFSLKSLGFKTTLEAPEPSRSDCHAWGAHPVYHYFASILGIRPSAPGFSRVIIEPQLADMPWAKGVLPHPKGQICADFSVRDGVLVGNVELPEDVKGTLVYGGVSRDLKPGRNVI